MTDDMAERIKIIHSIEKQVVAVLTQLDGGVPSAPKVGMYVKILCDSDD